MKVCIAEKPSVAREIAYILGARSRQDGYLEGNGYCVTWTFGHLCTLKEPDDYQADWKKWNLQTLPILPDNFGIKLIGNKGGKKQFGVIKKLLKQASLVINCGDAGQEGELIQRWVLEQAKYRGKVQRLWISSLTPEAIRDGFQQLKDAGEFDNLYHAGRSRAIGDWLLGMNATRLYTLKYGGYKQVLSVGRVQTPTLAMLVERHKEIENFVPTTYWELETLYRETVFQCEKGRFLKKEDGEALLKQVNGQVFTILSSERKKGKEYPPNLFDLTSLQVNANKRFGFTADKTLKIVQKLYEQKLVTYPRVDTVYLPNDQYPKIAGILGKLSQYAQFTQPLLGKTIRKSAKVFNDKKVTDHHAIIPTGQEKSLPIDEQRIYDAITRRFIAAFYPDCIVAKTTVIGEAAEIRFKATGKEILEQGWRVLYPKPPAKAGDKKGKTDSKKEDEKILPNFTEGEQGPHQPNLAEKQTTPPKNYTEATLLRAMETAGKKIDDADLRELMKANGIGRPSTRANIIETLFRRKYIERRKKLILPTEMGIQLIDTIQHELLKSAELTGQWEKQLRDIEDGSHTAERFIGDMEAMVTGLVKEVKQDEAATRLAMPQRRGANKWQKQKSTTEKPAGKTRPKAGPASNKLTEQSCPKCRKGKLLRGKTAYGCSRWQEGCDFRLPFVYAGKTISEKQLSRLLAKGSTVQLKGFKMAGSKEDGRLHFDDNYKLWFEPKDAQSALAKAAYPPPTKTKVKPKVNGAKPPCPKCGIGHIIRGKTAYGCSNWQTGCSFRFSFDELRRIANGRALTKELVLQILNGD
ncbi:type IA DNA topoisomerase [Flavilitoribacter nigricans]|uniref:DNA topoisomerase n=1 Tax=Flavilitoribacter nigricans (strain ATCC 23147 / DSM 23189 / NBRC 102662 / NCIMB 1420 / SS-2) TaxID=1122177 RepID=A0A2D0NE10_FLAN2|nr:type IA DNA topoisomerase [Flavilitoribacter nigricans]PHN06003.1 DNA topoisomerase III [Flavilitoribacter nigricans DSM 23189 = NBRC 102662]